MRVKAGGGGGTVGKSATATFDARSTICCFALVSYREDIERRDNKLAGGEADVGEVSARCKNERFVPQYLSVNRNKTYLVLNYEWHVTNTSLLLYHTVLGLVTCL